MDRSWNWEALMSRKSRFAGFQSANSCLKAGTASFSEQRELEFSNTLISKKHYLSFLYRTSSQTAPSTS